MRKKTIEEELKEIAAEKEAHIQELESITGHSDDHRYDFSPNEKSPKSSERTDTVSKSKKVSSSSTTKSNNEEFSFDDYCRMIKLEEKEQTDEEFKEYCTLMDRYADAPNKEELKESYDELQKTIKQDNETIAHFQKGINELNGILDDCKTRLKKIDDISKDVNKINQKPLGSQIGAIILLCIFVAAGLGVTIFVGIIPWMRDSNAVQVTATVQQVSYIKDDDNTYALMYVNYDFEGTTYEDVFVKMKVTQLIENEITIKINPKNPTQIILNSSNFNIFPTIFGIVFAGFALSMQIMLIVQIVKSKKTSK